eukprot:COSAG06_NODE_798_length_12214_cov_11.385987_6_plen_96_part_00
MYRMITLAAAALLFVGTADASSIQVNKPRGSTADEADLMFPLETSDYTRRQLQQTRIVCGAETTAIDDKLNTMLARLRKSHSYWKFDAAAVSYMY